MVHLDYGIESIVWSVHGGHVMVVADHTSESIVWCHNGQWFI
jgi:hypothetical protein